MNQYYCKRWLLVYLLSFLYACEIPPVSKQSRQNIDTVLQAKKRRANIFITEAKKLTQSGDLITRTGKDFTSQTFRQFSRKDNTYSHCGIVSIEQDTVFVYHAIGGEFNPDQKLVKEPIENFCNVLENVGFGLFRFSLNSQHQQALNNIVQRYYQQGLMFDTKFDLQSNERMYCSEFVSKAFSKALKSSNMFMPNQINNKTYMSVDNIFTHPSCKEVKRFAY